jgi:hypothetical protein
LKKIRENGNSTLNYQENKEWMKLLNVSFENTT